MEPASLNALELALQDSGDVLLEHAMIARVVRNAAVVASDPAQLQGAAKRTERAWMKSRERVKVDLPL